MLRFFTILALLCPLAFSAATDPLDVLKSDAPYAEKAEACRLLSIHGGPEAVEALAALLTDEQLSHMARMALEPMPGEEAGAALRAALDKTEGALKAGVVHSLGMRRDAQAASALAAVLAADESDAAQAAAAALARIASPEALNALTVRLAAGNLSPAMLAAVCDALFKGAETLLARNEKTQAAECFDLLAGVGNAPSEIRAAAWRGAALARGDSDRAAMLAAAIQGDDAALFAAALRTARELCGEGTSAALSAILPGLAPERKIPVIEALGECGGDVAGAALKTEAMDGPVGIRIAALRALTRIGHKPAPPLIAELIWSEDAALAQAARNSLSFFPDGGGDDIITAMLGDKKPEARLLAVQLVAKGALENPAEHLMAAAGADDMEEVRVAAIEALRTLAKPEHRPGLLGHLLGARSPKEMKAAETALAALGARQMTVTAGELAVQQALYGALPDGPMADVTEKVAKAVAAGATTIAANNGPFGDTAPGLFKKLRVDYTLNGAPFSRTVAEGESINLQTPSAPDAVVDAYLDALAKAKGEPKLALVRLLGSTGNAKALELLLKAAFDSQDDARETALRAVCEWPTPAVLPTVLELAKTSADPVIKTLALRGAVRLLGQSQMDMPELIGNYAALLESAGDTGDRKLALSGLAQVRSADALDMALRETVNEAVKPEALRAAVTIAKNLGKTPRMETALPAGTDPAGWLGNAPYWSVADGTIVGHSDTTIPKNEFFWAPFEVRDFYMVLDVKLDPPTANAGIQFRSKRVDDHGQAQGYQADMGQDVWGRLYHEHGRGKLDWTDRADAAVKPGEWNRYEILAVGPAIWTALNGTLGVAFLDLNGRDERGGGVSVQIHGGPPQTVHYRIERLVHDPEVTLAGLTPEQLIAELKALGN